jgi:chromosome segregation ATPase
LDKANQKIQELTNQLEQTTQERDKLRNLGIDLTTQLEQANRKNEELTNQLKHARLDGKSPLQRGDSNSKSPEEIEAIRKVTREWMLRKIDER